MKKTTVKLISVFLITLMLLAPLSVAALATTVPEGFEDAQPLQIGGTVDVTLISLSDFNTKENCYYFSINETGYYDFSVIEASSFTAAFIYDEEGYSYETIFFDSQSLVYFEQGKTYYLSIFTLRDFGESVSTQIVFSPDFYGEITNAEISKAPEKTEYIMGYDAYTMGLYYDMHLSGYITLEEYLEKYPEDANGIIEFDPYGIEIVVDFDSGKSLILVNYELGRIFDYYTLDEPIDFGTNTLRIVGSDLELFLDIEVIENPVEKIEITNLPDFEKLYIDFGTYFMSALELSKYFESIPPVGSEITIYYTDGTVEVLPIDENFIWGYHKGYLINTGVEIGENQYVFFVSYLGHEASYAIDYEFSGSLKKVMDLFERIFEIFLRVFEILSLFMY